MSKNVKNGKMGKREYAIKAIELLTKTGGAGMSLNEMGKALHYNSPNQRAKMYFGLKLLIAGGSVSYGVLRGKEKLFSLTGSEVIFPARKQRVKAEKPEKKVRVRKAKVAAETSEASSEAIPAELAPAPASVE